MAQASTGCACARIDVHHHFLPPVYVEALGKAGLRTLDGGMPIPAWSAEAAIAMMDRQGIATAMVSLSSPSATSCRPPSGPAWCVRSTRRAQA